MIRNSGLIFSSVLLGLLCLPSQKARCQVQDFISIPGPIQFYDVEYQLQASYNIHDTRYVQEYIPAGDDINHYKKMILLDVLKSADGIKSLIQKKVAELEVIKLHDPVANYEVYQISKTGEYILDFILASSTKGEINIVEWNAYRYKAVVDENGIKAIRLFAISIRAYKDDWFPFLQSLGITRAEYIKRISEYELPPIKIPVK